MFLVCTSCPADSKACTAEGCWPRERRSGPHGAAAPLRPAQVPARAHAPRACGFENEQRPKQGISPRHLQCRATMATCRRFCATGSSRFFYMPASPGPAASGVRPPPAQCRKCPPHNASLPPQTPPGPPSGVQLCSAAMCLHGHAYTAPHNPAAGLFRAASALFPPRARLQAADSRARGMQTRTQRPAHSTICAMSLKATRRPALHEHNSTLAAASRPTNPASKARVPPRQCFSRAIYSTPNGK